MARSVYENLIVKAKAAILGLGLSTDDGLNVTVDIGKLPTAKENLDTLPLLRLYPVNKHVIDIPWDTGTGDIGRKFRAYKVGIVYIAKRKRDRHEGVFEVMAIRQAVARRFGYNRCLDVPELMQTRFQPELPFNPRAYNLAYDYSVMSVEFSCVEPATS